MHYLVFEMPLMDRKKNSSLPQGEHRQRLDELHFMMAEEVLQTNLEKISDPTNDLTRHINDIVSMIRVQEKN